MIFDVLSKCFPKSRIASLALANFSQRVFTFLSFVLISRFLTPNEYGKYAYFLLVIGVVTELINAGFFQGLQNEISRNTSNANILKSIINISYFTNFVLSIICCSVVCLIYFVLESDIISFKDKTILGGIFVLFIFCSSYYSLGNIVFIAKQDAKNFFLSIFFQGIISLFLLSFFLYFDFKYAKIILLGFSFSYLFGVLFQTSKLKPVFHADLNAFFKILNKSKWFFLWSVSSVFESKIDMFFLSRNLNYSSLAVFDIASKYLIIGQVIITTLSQRFIPELLSKKDGGFDIQQKIKKSSLFLIPFLILLIIPIGLFINIFYSGRYNDSIINYAILTIAMIFNLLNINNTSKLISNNLEKYLFFLTFFAFLIKIPISYLFIMKLNTIGASVSTSMNQLLTYLIFLLFIKKTKLIAK